MGKGKGNLKDWVCKIKAGTSLFYIKSLNPELTLLSLKKGINKLPLKIQIKNYV